MTFSIDGGSRGNPGPAGYGVHIIDAVGAVVDELYDFIGVATNNVAEYSGLLAALRYAVAHDCHTVTIRSDSLLLVCQMKGEYKVKNPGLQTLHAEARQLAGRLERVRYVHVPREENREADALANRAMDFGKPRAPQQHHAPTPVTPACPAPAPKPKPAQGTWPPTGRLF
jgi:probable phosphoglycerate mutase